MKILMLQGSPKNGGNTATMLGWMKEAMKENAHDVEILNLGDYEIKGCLGCAACKEIPDAIGCVQDDDAEAVLTKMMEADLTIFSSPAYFWGFTAQMKALMDRSWGLVTGYHTPEHASLVEGKKQALFVIGGGPYDGNVEGLFFAFNKLAAFYKSENAGELYIGACKMGVPLPEDAREKVDAFVEEILA